MFFYMIRNVGWRLIHQVFMSTKICPIVRHIIIWRGVVCARVVRRPLMDVVWLRWIKSTILNILHVRFVLNSWIKELSRRIMISLFVIFVFKSYFHKILFFVFWIFSFQFYDFINFVKKLINFRITEFLNHQNLK